MALFDHFRRNVDAKSLFILGCLGRQSAIASMNEYTVELVILCAYVVRRAGPNSILRPTDEFFPANKTV